MGYIFGNRGLLYMKKALLIACVLFIAVISTACINNMAVQELNNKAAEYMKKGDYESAINRLEASLDLDSSIYETYYNLGIAATGAKKYELAIDSFEKGIKINSENPNLYYSLAVAQNELSDTLLEDGTSDDDEKNLAEDNLEVKKQVIMTKKLAQNNFKKYLSLSPKADDREEVEEIITEIEEFIKENASLVK